MSRNSKDPHNPADAERGPEEGLIPSFPSSGIFEQLERIEKKLDALFSAFNIKQSQPSNIIKLPYLDQAEFKRSIRDLAKGNKKTLQRYIDRGGKIPKSGG